MILRVLVTGAAGYLGSAIVRDLCRDHEVTSLSRSQTLAASHHISCDLNDGRLQEAVRAICPDVIVHAAAKVTQATGDLPALLRENVAATSNLLAAALSAGCLRLINCSTISVYKVQSTSVAPLTEEFDIAPRGSYGQTKWLCEQAAGIAAGNDEAFKVISLRFSGIHGAPRRNGALARMALAGIRGEPIEVSEPASIFSFVFLEDACAAVRAALTADLSDPHTVVNIGGSTAWTLGEWANAVARLTGGRSAVRNMEDRPARQEALNISRAGKLLGYEPKPAEVHLKTLIDDLRNPREGAAVAS